MEADEALKVCEELCGSYSASSIPKTFGAASGSLCLYLNWEWVLSQPKRRRMV